MTTKSKYESIMRDGFIKMSGSKLNVEKGVYAFDLCNFFKCWGKHKDWGYEDLQYAILRHIVRWYGAARQGTGDLVILKIPTANLDSDKLSIRSMNKLFKFEESEQKFSDLTPFLREHLTGETSAKETPLYKMRKEALEFIYKDDIPIEKCQRIGSIVNIATLRKDLAFGVNPVKYIMQSLLAGTPEQNCTKLFN
ncbi:MAG: hypothetical protein NC408_00955 [Candidatus Gastranaerophilales bacterium]|nr:hypothetical protein [Candidatus Gastranaerophilales bacterium]